MLKTGYLSFLVLCLSLAGFLSGPDLGHADWRIDVQKQLRILIDRSPPYKRGGVNPNKGLDCSGYIFIACRFAGLPVKRSTSLRMSMGLDGWQSTPVGSIGARLNLDLIFFTIKRKNQHVGMVMEKDKFTHASSSRGVTLSELNKGYWSDKITGLRRLNF